MKSMDHPNIIKLLAHKGHGDEERAHDPQANVSMVNTHPLQIQVALLLHEGSGGASPKK